MHVYVMSKIISWKILGNSNKVAGQTPKPLVALIEINPMAE